MGRYNQRDRAEVNINSKIEKNRHRNYRSFEQGSIELGRAGFWPVSKQNFPSAQTRRKVTTGDQVKGFERFHSIRSLQNGRHLHSARSASALRLAGEDRPEGYAFCDSNLEGSQEVSPLCLEEYTPRVCMPSLWANG